jgi:hypothetical protein
MQNEFLPYNQVFFVHYQCEKFNEGQKIYNLSTYSKGKVKEYLGNEAENIKEYAAKVNELLNEGLTLVHWNQNRTIFGTDHIKKRYKDLTGKDLELEYNNEINLSELLISKFGQNYISHPRLDSLAKLNQFNGIKETELDNRTFSSNRLLLLTKIYFNALNNNLKTEVETLLNTLPTQSTAKQKSELEKKNEPPIIQDLIKDYFRFMSKDDPRKYEPILPSDDYNKLIEWITFYYQNKFSIPEIKNPIEKVNTTRGNIFFAFMDFFKKIYPSGRSYPESLFTLIKKCFYQYRNDKISNMMKTSKPQYFDDLLRN